MKTLTTQPKNLLFAIGLCFFLWSSGYAQKVVVYNTSNSNIADNTVRAIFIDAYNVKWIGTDKGLCRFDDTTWTIFSSADKIGDAPINDLALQHTKYYGDELWIATSKGVSVAAFGVDGITAATNYTKASFPLHADSIVAVAVDTGGTRYFASTNGITWFKGNKWGTVTHDSLPSSIPSDPILTLFARNDSLYIGTQGYGAAHGGVGRLKMSVDGVSGASIIQGPYCGNLNNAVHAILIDSKARQWFGTEGGLYEHQGQVFKGEGWLRYFSREQGLCGDTVLAIAESPNQHIWVGTNAGLNVITDDTLYRLTTSGGLPSNTIYDIAFDTLGNAWLATANGLVKVVPDFYTDVKYFTHPTASNVKIFPNPTHGMLTVQLAAHTQAARIVLIDMNGRIVLKKDISSPALTIDLSSNVQKGIYFLQVHTPSHVSVQKILFY